MKEADRGALARARKVLENPGLAIRLTDLVGRPVEMAVAALPAAASRQIHRATGAALDRALAVALRTMDADPDPPRDWFHRLAAGAAGAGGGAFGLAGLAVELPISTTLMLRAIADHARAQGEDLARPEPRLQCLAVFAYGSPRAADDAAEAGYFAMRAALARSVSEAAEWVATKGISRAAADRSAPALARLLATVAKRFGVAVSEVGLPVCADHLDPAPHGDASAALLGRVLDESELRRERRLVGLAGGLVPGDEASRRTGPRFLLRVSARLGLVRQLDQVPHLSVRIAESGEGAKRLCVRQAQRWPVDHLCLLEVGLPAGGLGPVEADLRVGPVAEGLLRRPPAAAERVPLLGRKDLPLLPAHRLSLRVHADDEPHQRQRATHQVGAVLRDLHAPRYLRHGGLRSGSCTRRSLPLTVDE
ncbi:MAG: EcsC family protein [Deltaproteobacteria bacterium]|nr:EcsC family protein [Deltaproteobacteria bacterium]